jgi:hypothetical protein
MVDLLKDIIRSPAGSFGSVAALFGLAFWLVHWITKKVVAITSAHDRLTISVEKMEENFEKMREDIVYLKVNFDVIKDIFHPLSQARSPLSLTEQGKKIAEELEATEAIVRSWSKIYADLEENIAGKNAYDIQQYCVETATVDLSRFISDADLDKVKMYAFNHGKPLAYYAPVFAIPIRDQYFKQKGINISEVDSKASGDV